jgi:hypothetical protein
MGGLAGVLAGLAGLDQDVPDAVRIERLRWMEQAKAALAAAQAREAVAFAASQRAQQLAAGVPAERADRGIAAQVGLALRVSPWHAARFVGWSRILTTELPHTYAALARGQTTQRRAMLVARETIWLSREHRAAVDAELAPRLPQLGDRRVEAETKRLGYRLDPAGFVARARLAERERRVSLRPAPDTMARLTALVPMAQGVAAYATLCRDADTTVAGGDERGRGQIMADTLIERLTGQEHASAVPVEVNLVMTDRALLSPHAPGGDEPALLDGEPIPAPLARALILDTDETGTDEQTGAPAPRWLRRLFTNPATGQLVAMESARRTFTPAQRRYLRLRDRHCRTPWCEAPIRHADHITPAESGGPTTLDNAQGYCQACNHAKQAPGWTTSQQHSPTGPHHVVITTPTGHRYHSRAPDPPQAA